MAQSISIKGNKGKQNIKQNKTKENKRKKLSSM
jgi:transposase